MSIIIQKFLYYQTNAGNFVQMTQKSKDLPGAQPQRCLCLCNRVILLHGSGPVKWPGAESIKIVGYIGADIYLEKNTGDKFQFICQILLEP